MSKVPAAPFQEWIRKRIDFYDRQYEFGGERYGSSDACQRTAFDLGISPKQLRNYRDGLDSMDRPIEAYDRDRVEEALFHAGTFMWEVGYDSEELDDPFGEAA